MKKLLFIILGIHLAFAVSAYDFGGNLMDSTYLYDADQTDFYHKDTLTLWAGTPIGDQTSLSFRGSYTWSTEDPVFFDLDLFKWESSGTGKLAWTAGRFPVSDYSGYIYSGKIDGLSVTWNFPRLILGVRTGYTGLMFNQSFPLEMTLADSNDNGDPDVLLTSPRLLAGLQAFFPELIGAHDFKFETWVQFDMRDDTNLNKAGSSVYSSQGGKLSSQYFGIYMNGPVVKSLYYDGFAYLETGSTLSYTGTVYEETLLLGFLASAALKYYQDQGKYMRFSLRFLYSSGDADYENSFLEGNTEGAATNFTAVTRQSLAEVFSPQLGNLFLTRISYSLKPFAGGKNRIMENLQTEITNVNFFRSTTGQISETGINSGSSSLYLGSEIDAALKFRPLSDLGLSISGGVFIPGTGSSGAFSDTERGVELFAKAELSMSF